MLKYLPILLCLCTACPASRSGMPEQFKDSSGMFFKTEVQPEVLQGATIELELTDFGIMDTCFRYENMKIYPTVYHLDEEPQYRLAVLAETGKKTDTIYNELIGTDASVSFNFSDMNFDGYPDLAIFFLDLYTNEQLFLYDPRLKTYKELKGYSDYQQSTVMDSARELRYSYEAAGCADMAWFSNLFSIKGTKIIPYASLSFDACDTQVLYTFEQKGKLPVKKRLYFKNEKELDRFDKFAWLERFWNDQLKSNKIVWK